MKIRNGFVSNSSSSSFILIGNTANTDNRVEFIQHIKERLTDDELTELKSKLKDGLEYSSISNIISELYELDNYSIDILNGNDSGLIRNEIIIKPNMIFEGDYISNDRILITEDMVGKYIIYGSRMS